MDFNRAIIITKECNILIPSTGKPGYFPITFVPGLKATMSNAPLEPCFLKDGSIVPGVLVKMPERVIFPFAIPLDAIQLVIQPETKG